MVRYYWLDFKYLPSQRGGEGERERERERERAKDSVGCIMVLEVTITIWLHTCILWENIIVYLPYLHFSCIVYLFYGLVSSGMFSYRSNIGFFSLVWSPPSLRRTGILISTSLSPESIYFFVSLCFSHFLFWYVIAVSSSISSESILWFVYFYLLFVLLWCSISESSPLSSESTTRISLYCKLLTLLFDFTVAFSICSFIFFVRLLLSGATDLYRVNFYYPFVATIFYHWVCFSIFFLNGCNFPDVQRTFLR